MRTCTARLFEMKCGGLGNWEPALPWSRSDLALGAGDIWRTSRLMEVGEGSSIHDGGPQAVPNDMSVTGPAPNSRQDRKYQSFL